MQRLLMLVLVFVLVAVAALAHAEKVDLPPAGLRKTATHVVTGTVKAIYERKERKDGWAYTRYVAEVAIDAVEKGAGLEKGRLAYVRYWRRSYVGGKPPPSTSGHRGLPKAGETLRIYLARNAYDGFGKTQDGGLNVIGANGFERLSRDK